MDLSFLANAAALLAVLQGAQRHPPQDHGFTWMGYVQNQALRSIMLPVSQVVEQC